MHLFRILTQYSRIEGSKTDPSFSAVVRMTKARGIELTELFQANELFKEVNFKNRTLMEKILSLIRLAKMKNKPFLK